VVKIQLFMVFSR